MLKPLSRFKPAQLAMLMSAFYFSPVWSETPLRQSDSLSENVEAAKLLTQELGANMAEVEAGYRAEAERQAELARQAEQARIEAEKKAEEERIAAEKQQQAEAKIQQIVGQNELQFKPTVAKIYMDNDYHKLWTDAGAEKQFLREYSAVVVSGISRKAPKILEEISRTDPQSLAYDVLLTDAFLDYMYYSRNILKYAQQWLYAANTYRAKAPSDADIAAWLDAVKQHRQLQFVKGLSSDNPQYLQTLERLARSLPKDGKVQPVVYEEVTVVEPVATAAPTGPSAGLTSTLYPGDVSPEVTLLIRALKQRGYLKNHIDGQYYAQGVVEAVKQFQAKNGLAADGVVGAGTRALLNGQSKPQQKVTKVKKVAKNQGKGGVSTADLYKLAINAQRLRVIPDFNNGIFVNIPSYQLQYFRDGKLILQSRVIVGKDARRTPVMYSELSNVVVNPPWNAPARLTNEDIIPKVRRDPSYLERRGYTILDSQGRTVNPYTINWNSIDPKKFPYRLRQRPGDDSALGRYKFNMPSSDAIYLHDTPSKGLFNKKDRALSSGCVRVEKSDELATILLREAGWSDSRKQKVLASNKTTSAPIHSHNPVYLYYVTAWEDNGQLHVLPDIYNYDVTPNLSQINWHTVSKYLL